MIKTLYFKQPGTFIVVYYKDGRVVKYDSLKMDLVNETLVLYMPDGAFYINIKEISRHIVVREEKINKRFNY